MKFSQQRTNKIELIQDIDSVSTLDYTSSYINWTIVKTTNNKDQFEVKQQNSLQIDLNRKPNFTKTFNEDCLLIFIDFFLPIILFFKLFNIL